MDPEQIKDVFNKIQDFEKPKLSPVVKLLGTGLANLDGEKWKIHRKIINPAFHLEKLKVIHTVHSFMMSNKFQPMTKICLKMCYVHSFNNMFY